jgi:predicted nucleic-acid-binding Zn-ribbon protein|nr:MAG TPA: DNA-directed RNA polymerase II subunit [Caudoviricetes sp.]
MEFKQCPNCGLVYNDGSYYCMKCNVRLKPAKEVDYVKHPELSDVEDRIIGTVSAGGNSPKCPTCGSTNIEKISLTRKAIGGALFGLFSSDVRKTMHCKNCGYKW